MCKILMPIKPKYVQGIMSGDKKYEFRKILAKRKVDKIIIYETSPVMKVVAEVMINNILVDHPEVIWNKTYEYAGINKNDYDKYYQDNKQAVAYSLGEVEVFEKPRELKDYGIHFFPQSYVYID